MNSIPTLDWKDSHGLVDRGLFLAAVRKMLVVAVGAAVALLANPTAGAASSAASALPAPRFEPTSCPTEPFPTTLPANARCGFLIVPEIRARANGRTIRLTVGIVPAASPTPAPDPVVYMTGGPGGYPLGEAQPLIEAGFNRDRDLILMSQRGTLYAPQTRRRRARSSTGRRHAASASRSTGPGTRA